MDKVKGKSGVGRKVEVRGGEVIRKKIRSGVKVGAGQNLEAKKKKANPLLLSHFSFFFFFFSFLNASRLDIKTMVGQAYD